jgi:transcriptional regulator with XRE-family HTH domain
MPLVSTVKPDGPKIRARRERLGLTQDDLARLTKRHRKTISDIECGNQAVASLMIIGQIARVLGEQPEDLIKTGVAA